jgi:hypothetical protein
MRSFAGTWTDVEFVQRAVAQLPFCTQLISATSGVSLGLSPTLIIHFLTNRFSSWTKPFKI